MSNTKQNTEESALKMYESKLPILRVQKEYHTLIRDISVAQAEALNAQLAIAQMQQKDENTEAKKPG